MTLPSMPATVGIAEEAVDGLKKRLDRPGHERNDSNAIKTDEE